MGTSRRSGASAPNIVLLAFAAAILLAPNAAAAQPDFLFRMPEGTVTPGSGAAEVNHPRSIAVNPATGHAYVGELENSRVAEYTAWGLFVRAWGWNVAPEGASGDTPSDEFEVCGPVQPEGTPPTSLCQAGASGSGAGQLDGPRGMAVDTSGAVYVFDGENLRVQKFSATGGFELMFGGDVNKTKVEEGAPAAQRNVCPVAPTDVCQAGAPGTGPSHLSDELGDFLAYSEEADALVVGDHDRIQIFDTDGGFREEIPFEAALAPIAGQQVNGLDIGPDGDIFFTLLGVPDVQKISPAGIPLAPGKVGESKFDVAKPLGVAVDAQGNVYTAEVKVLFIVGRYVLGYDADGDPIPGLAQADEFGRQERDDLTALTTNQCEGSEGAVLYLGRNNQGFGVPYSYVEAYGPSPIGCEPPPPRPPEILDQFAIAVGHEEAVVQARINPKFLTDTTYYVEYGNSKCSEGGCAKAPLSPLALSEKSVNKAVTTIGVVLDGLVPGANYRFRFVAESGGGGVFGLDPDGIGGPAQASAAEGLEATFKTVPVPDESPACSNDAVRMGPSAKLPDCRAYEMVSPLNKGGADVALWITRNAVRARLLEIDQSDLLGDRFTYTSATGFDDPQSAPFVSQYMADRTAAGWTSEPISPPHTESPLPADATFANDFLGFAPDLCWGWIRHFSVAPLVDGGVEDYTNLYRAGYCDSPGYEAITTPPPPHRSSDEYVELSVKGFTDDGEHTIFTVDDALHPDAPTLKAQELLLYEHTSEGLRFVCYLPDGTPSPQACSAGTLMGEGASDISNLHNAISADGSRIFWTASSGIKRSRASHPGQIYVRIDGTQTRKVSTAKAPDPAFFWTASEDGSNAIFSFASGTLEDQLYELDIETETPTLIAKGVEGPMGASEDASRVYFASKEDLDEGGAAAAGDHNLYLYEASAGGGSGDFTFIMELTGKDIGLDQPTVNDLPVRPVAFSPATRAAAVSPDGLHAVFMSSVGPTPTGYDNRDAVSDEPTAQVYLYDAAENALRCLSCKETGARPSSEFVNPFWLAATIQGWEALHRSPRILSDDGQRVYFESVESLTPRDTNGTWDVYQWEEAEAGSCTEDRETFSDSSGGCVDLISSGQSPGISTFLDADPDGQNVFFGTQASLVKADPGLNDVYVARVGGGFPEKQRKAECEGDGCQSPPSPPPVVTPASQVFHGPASDRPRGGKHRHCSKGKRRVRRKGKVRCVPKRAANRGGGRGR